MRWPWSKRIVDQAIRDVERVSPMLPEGDLSCLLNAVPWSSAYQNAVWNGPAVSVLQQQQMQNMLSLAQQNMAKRDPYAWRSTSELDR